MNNNATVLTTQEVFLYYDTPLLFRNEDDRGNNYLCLAVDMDEKGMFCKWLYARLDENTWKDLKNKKIDTRNAFLRTSKEFLYSVGYENKAKVAKNVEIDNGILPDAGQFLPEGDPNIWRYSESVVFLENTIDMLNEHIWLLKLATDWNNVYDSKNISVSLKTKIEPVNLNLSNYFYLTDKIVEQEKVSLSFHGVYLPENTLDCIVNGEKQQINNSDISLKIKKSNVQQMKNENPALAA